MVFTTAALGIAPLFLPFFREWNPFTVAGLFLPSWLIVLALTLTTVVASLREGWRWSLSTAVFGMDAMVFIYALRILSTEGWDAAIMGSAVDISYFLLSAPFHLFLLFQAEERACSDSEPV